MEETNKLYSPGEVAELLNVSTSTIRRLTSAIEEKGYTRITRDSKNHRRYDLTDIRTLEYLHDRINKDGYTQSAAVNDTYNNLDYILNKVDPIPADNQTDTNEQIAELTNKVNKLIEIIGVQNNEIKDLKGDMVDLQATNKRLNESINNRLAIEYKDSENLDNKGISDSVSDKDNDDNQTTIDDYISDDKQNEDIENQQPMTNDDDKETLADYSNVQPDQGKPKKKKGIFSRLFGR